MIAVIVRSVLAGAPAGAGVAMAVLAATLAGDGALDGAFVSGAGLVGALAGGAIGGAIGAARLDGNPGLGAAPAATKLRARVPRMTDVLSTAENQIVLPRSPR